MLFQLHWQNLSIGKTHETQFVAQASSDDFPDVDDLMHHFREIIDRREDECPEGWGPMICTEDAKEFVLAAK